MFIDLLHWQPRSGMLSPASKATDNGTTSFLSGIHEHLGSSHGFTNYHGARHTGKQNTVLVTSGHLPIRHILLYVKDIRTFVTGRNRVSASNTPYK